MNEVGADADRKDQSKRVMTPAIESMTVKEERACLSEIRKLGTEVDHHYRLSNGWTTGMFALMYVTGQHVKRKSKPCREKLSPISDKVTSPRTLASRDGDDDNLN